MREMPRCSVPGCKARPVDGKSWTLHKISKKPHLRKQFLNYLKDHGRDESEIAECSRVCEVHFEYKICPDGTKCRLFDYPTVPRDEWNIKDDQITEEEPTLSKPTHIVKICLDALRTGDDDNLIKKITKVRTKFNLFDDEIRLIHEINDNPTEPIESQYTDIVARPAQTKNVTLPSSNQRFVIKTLPQPLKINAPKPSTSVAAKILRAKKIPTVSLKSAVLVTKIIPAASSTLPLDPLNIKQEPEASTSESNFRIEAVHENYQDVDCSQLLNEAMEVDIKLEKEETNDIIQEVESYQCTKCPETFAFQSLLFMHDNQTHQQNAKYKCPRCQFTSETLGGMITHSKRCQKIAATQGKPGSFPIRRVLPFLYACSICFKRFPTANLVFDHEKKHGKEVENSFECQFCNQKFNSQKNLFDHLQEKHRLTSDSLFKKVTFICSMCKMEINSLEALKTHKIAAHKGCPYCGKIFISASILNFHIANIHRDNSIKLIE